METLILASNPDYIDPAISFPVGIALWAIMLIQWRRNVIKARKAERVEHAEMLAQYEASLRRSGWGE